MILAVDFDLTICSDSRYGPPMEGAAQKLRWLYPRHTVVVHSVKANSRGGKDAIDAWLARNEIPYHAVVGKFQADRYIDDKAIHFENWEQVWNALR